VVVLSIHPSHHPSRKILIPEEEDHPSWKFLIPEEEEREEDDDSWRRQQFIHMFM
jgi:hypothetical protein